MLESLAPARRRFVLVLVALLCAAAVAGAAAAGVRLLDRRPPVAQDRLGPVLLVAGYGGNTAALEPLRTALQEAGRTVVVVSPLADNTADLDAQARALDDVAARALQSTHAPSVDVIGYSAGGVVARLWVRDHDGGSEARRVLTVGSPHHGANLAGLAAQAGCPTACQQLAPDSPTLRRLNAGDETPDGPIFISVWSTSDQVVTPPDSARLEGALDFTVQSVCPDATTPHSGLPGDPVVLAALRTALGPGPPRAPSSCPSI